MPGLRATIQPASEPASAALHYLGELRAGDGLPVMGAHVIGVELWDAARDGARLCAVGAQAIEVDHGQFSLALSEDCAAAFGHGRAAWADLQVDGERLSPRAPLVTPHVQPTKPRQDEPWAAPSDALQPAAADVPPTEQTKEQTKDQTTDTQRLDAARDPILCI